MWGKYTRFVDSQQVVLWNPPVFDVSAVPYPGLGIPWERGSLLCLKLMGPQVELSVRVSALTPEMSQ